MTIGVLVGDDVLYHGGSKTPTDSAYGEQCNPKSEQKTAFCPFSIRFVSSIQILNTEAKKTVITPFHQPLTLYSAIY
jgi:hypothetical protein